MMKGQSRSKWNMEERRWSIYEYMVLCVSIGLGFRYIKNYQNKTLRIQLKRDKILYLDFGKWTSDLERAVINEMDVQIPVRLSDFPEIIKSEGDSRQIEITKEIKTWLDILYKSDISFEYCQRALIVEAQKNSSVQDFEFVIRFSKVGAVSKACCKFKGERHHFYYDESLKATFYRYLDMADKRNDDENGLVS